MHDPCPWYEVYRLYMTLWMTAWLAQLCLASVWPTHKIFLYVSQPLCSVFLHTRTSVNFAILASRSRTALAGQCPGHCVWVVRALRCSVWTRPSSHSLSWTLHPDPETLGSAGWMKDDNFPACYWSAADILAPYWLPVSDTAPAVQLSPAESKAGFANRVQWTLANMDWRPWPRASQARNYVAWEYTLNIRMDRTWTLL